MSKRLVKIAKELNVGTSTIVEFLTNVGFEVENKPTAKISDDMYAQLVEQFSKFKELKAQADKLIIGNPRRAEIPKVVESPPSVVPPPVTSLPKEEKTLVEKTKESKDDIIRVEKQDIKVKVVGKVALSPPAKPKDSEVKAVSKPKTKPETKSETKPETKPEIKPEIKPETKPTEQNEPKSAEKQKGDKKLGKGYPEPVEMVRSKTPQLKGLKVLGKIDSSRLEKPKPKTKPKPTASQNNNNDRKKRKRKRKKVPAQNAGAGKPRDNKGVPSRGGARSGRREEIKQVSQKEIEEKIKATMARITGGRGKKRQKIRRDNREDKRVKQELIEEQIETQKSVIPLTEFVSVSELASLLDIAATDVIMTCMNLGVIVSINQRLDAEIIELVAEEFEREIKFISAEETEEEEEEIVDAEEDLEPRGSIVTVMGHVDHGKTSLLDHIRKANVAAGEAGGITQHIGAYEVVVKEKKITFLDTPGHEAFTAMRARGAKVTDVAIIIIAADDRIMPQTKEAISHAQAAGVPMIFAINKIDKDGANPEKIKEELATMNLLVESWGGTFQSQDISAKSGEGIDELLEKVVLEAELLELKANPKREAHGTVLEASLDKGRGYVTKMLVQNGTLKIGDAMVTGAYSGKVKAMFDDKNSRIKSAGPSVPVLVLGLNGAPQAGEKFKVVDNETEARNIATKRQQISREQSNRASKRLSLDEIGRRLALGSFKELNLIVKGDVDGSIEALSDSLIKLSVESVQVNVIHKAVGQIAESDVLLASASDAIIIGFQVRPSGTARQLAENEGVQIKTYSIIYEAIDEIKAAMEGMLDTIKEEEIICEIEVRETFKISKIGTIAGCYVNSGKVSRKTLIRLIRDGIVVYPNKEGTTGELTSLKRFKDDASEVKAGFECGLTLKNFNDIKIGDIIEGYQINEVKQTL
ncbi:MAG: translation initiation factor IF-2 [Saprospiraceae bacterium]